MPAAPRSFAPALAFAVGASLSVPVSMPTVPVVAIAALALGGCARTAAGAPRAFHATGTIKSFGPGRAYVNIAHDDIPGYMAAMTMSFEPKAAPLLEGYAEKDRVAFEFAETDDGRRVITSLAHAK